MNPALQGEPTPEKLMKQLRENTRRSFKSMLDVYEQVERIPIDYDSRIVIASDWHLGDGSKNDDFLHNAELINYVLENYYLKRDFTLIQNGDIEELLRFDLNVIRKTHARTYRILDKFDKKKQFYKNYGNHDVLEELLPLPYKIHEGLVLQYKNQDMFIFHGHQTNVYSGMLDGLKYRKIAKFILRNMANPLNMNNYAVAYDNEQKFKVEKRAHEFARLLNIISIIGHTHRPLFESRPKSMELENKIDMLLDAYTSTKKREVKERIKFEVLALREELRKAREEPDSEQTLGNYYNKDLESLPVPCLFNAGCGIGKNGFSCIEIKNGKIFLVFWSHVNRSKSYERFNIYKKQKHIGDGYYRDIKMKAPLQEVFDRIDLLR